MATRMKQKSSPPLDRGLICTECSFFPIEWTAISQVLVPLFSAPPPLLCLFHFLLRESTYARTEHFKIERVVYSCPCVYVSQQHNLPFKITYIQFCRYATSCGLMNDDRCLKNAMAICTVICNKVIVAKKDVRSSD